MVVTLPGIGYEGVETDQGIVPEVAEIDDLLQKEGVVFTEEAAYDFDVIKFQESIKDNVTEI